MFFSKKQEAREKSLEEEEEEEHLQLLELWNRMTNQVRRQPLIKSLIIIIYLQ